MTEAANKRVEKVAERLHAMRYPPPERHPLRDFRNDRLSRAEPPIAAEALRALFSRNLHPSLDDLQGCVWEALRFWPPAWRLRQHHLLRRWVEGDARSDLLADDVHAAVVSIDDESDHPRYWRVLPTERVGLAALVLSEGYGRPDAQVVWAIVTEAQLNQYQSRPWGPLGLPPDPDPALVPYRTTRELLAALDWLAQGDGRLTETEGLTQAALARLRQLAK